MHVTDQTIDSQTTAASTHHQRTMYVLTTPVIRDVATTPSPHRATISSASRPALGAPPWVAQHAEGLRSGRRA